MTKYRVNPAPRTIYRHELPKILKRWWRHADGIGFAREMEKKAWELAGEEPLEMRYRLVKLPRTEINASQLEPSDVYDLARLVLAGEDPAHLHFFMCNEAEAAVRDLIYGLNDVLLRPDDFPDIHPDSVVTSNGV